MVHIVKKFGAKLTLRNKRFSIDLISFYDQRFNSVEANTISIIFLYMWLRGQGGSSLTVFGQLPLGINLRELSKISYIPKRTHPITLMKQFPTTDSISILR
jgi:hypothetical protein